MNPEPFVISLGAAAHFPILTERNARALRSGMVTLAPGAGCGEHGTENYEELLIFLEGAGEARLAGREPFAVGVGRAFYIPPGTTHEVFNTGASPLRYIYVVAPVKL